MKYDFHSHFLPGIDDGAKDPAQSVAILKYLSSNGIEKVCATPHYSSHRESVEHFLERRESAKCRLFEYMKELGRSGTGDLPEIVFGAEVKLERGLSEKKDIEKLALGTSGHILLELPLNEKYESWMSEEIYNVRYQFGVSPIMAHINRYYALYSKSEYDELFLESDLALQINCESMIGLSSSLRTKKLIKYCDSIVLGCDIHDPKKTAESGLEKMLAFTGKLPAEKQNQLAHVEKYILG